MISRFIDLIINGLMALNGWLRRSFSESVVRFRTICGATHLIFPVLTAKEIKPAWLVAMIQKAKDEKKPVKFVRCPGMHDYIQEGFIIRAHTDIHIKANGAGTVITTPHNFDPILTPSEMDLEVVAGVAPVQGVKPKIWKVPLPYGIFMEPGHSMHLLPAFLHSPELMDKVFVFPGTVDYEEFHTANWILVVIKPCEFVIKAGTPLLQALPFKRVNYHGVAGAATPWEKAKHKYGFPSRITGFYRRMFHFKKIYTSEVQE
jgi:hypothetical protein